MTGNDIMHNTYTHLRSSLPVPRSSIGCLILYQQKQILENLTILVIDDGRYFKLSLKCFYFELKLLRQFNHFNPFFHLLEKLYQTEKQPCCD